MVERIRGKGANPTSVILETQLIARKTTVLSDLAETRERGIGVSDADKLTKPAT